MPAPTRIDDDLFAAAKDIAPVMSRSAAQQINHWARIGRELEASRGVTVSRLREVLTGTSHYDDLDEETQAVVRATWAELVEATRRQLDLAADFQRAGRSYVEADEHGNVVRHTPERH